MSTFDEDQVERATDGKFAPKSPAGEVEVDLGRLDTTPPAPVFAPRRISDVEAMDQVATALGGQESWSGADVCEQLNNVLAMTGRPTDIPDGVRPDEDDEDAYGDAYADHLRAWKAAQEPDLSTRAGLQAELDTQMQAWREASNRIDLASAKLMSDRLRTEFPDARYLTLDESDQGGFMEAGQLLAADMKPIMVTDARGYTELAVDAMRDVDGPYSSREDQSELEEDLARVANFQTDGRGRAIGMWDSWCVHHRSQGYVLDLDKVDAADCT